LLRKIAANETRRCLGYQFREAAYALNPNPSHKERVSGVALRRFELSGRRS